MALESKVYKVIFVGDACVGKTTLINRHRTGHFDGKYNYTDGVEVGNLSFNTSYGNITLEIWDCGGSLKGQGLGDGYYIGGHAAVIMFDVTKMSTYTNVERWYKSLRQVIGPDAPIVICGNKVDTINRVVKPRDIKSHIRKGLPYYDISAKSNYQFEKPFLSIIRSLTGDEEI